MSRKLFAFLLLPATSLLSAGCAQILGIEKATCDRTFDPQCNPKLGAADTGLTPPDNTSPLVDAAPAGPTCEGYCDTIASACSALPQFASRAACLRVCNETFGAQEDTSLSGDNLTCRFSRAESAAESGGDGCVEAGMLGGGACGEICAVYCHDLAALCPEQFDLIGDCQAACAAVPRTGKPFSSPADSANTLECRFYHLQLSTKDSFPHCDHAVGKGPPGSQLCAASPQ